MDQEDGKREERDMRQAWREGLERRSMETRRLGSRGSRCNEKFGFFKNTKIEI